MGHAQSSRWIGIGLAYPTDHETTLEAIHWARMATKEDAHIVTILLVHHNDWTTQNLSINTTTYIHTIMTIPPHPTPSPTNPRRNGKYYNYVKPSLRNTM